jgi:dihydrofolate synthase/folylpolyglutamate synthase
LGEHQVHNAGAAIATVFAIPQLKNVVSEQAIRDGIANVKFAGRIEQIAASLPDGRRTILLDIAHNAASASALAETIASEQAFADVSFDARRLLFACSEDKDIKAILAPLLPLFGTICFTRFLENPRSCCPDQLIALANEIIDENQLPRPAMTKETDPNNGAEFLLENSAPSDLVVIAGSVFLVAELRKWACELSFSLGSAAS